jgi:hypothetical protein
MMTKFASFASLLALAVTSVPAGAADVRGAAFGGGPNRLVSQPFMFGGGTLRLGFGGHKANRPELALRFTGGTQDADMHMRIGEGLAFSAVPGSKPRLTLQGQDSSLIMKRLGMSGGTKAALVVGGIALVGGIVLVATQAGKGADGYWDDE